MWPNRFKGFPARCVQLQGKKYPPIIMELTDTPASRPKRTPAELAEHQHELTLARKRRWWLKYREREIVRARSYEGRHL